MKDIQENILEVIKQRSETDEKKRQSLNSAKSGYRKVVQVRFLFGAPF
jgi:hypothetical protein